MSIGDILLFFVITLTALFSCSPDVAVGSGTQTTNGICIVAENGAISGYVYQVASEGTGTEIPFLMPPVTVQLFDSGYTAFESSGIAIKRTPDSNGAFGFTALQPGRYSLFAYDTVSGHGIHWSDISVIEDISAGSMPEKKLFSPCGTIHGVIKDLSQREADACGAYIPGTPFFEIADSAGMVVFRNVPPGTYTVKTDYFSGSRSRGYLRIKGYIPTHDTLVVYTDSVKVEISSDTLMHRVELSL